MSQESAALRAELDEERRKYQGLLREFNRLEQRYDNLREMSLLTEVQNLIHRHTLILLTEIQFRSETPSWFLLTPAHQVPQKDGLCPESELGASVPDSAVTPVSHPDLPFTLPICLPFPRGGPQDQCDISLL